MQLELIDPASGSTGNVIQAVAENGVTVPPILNTPALDISSVVVEIDSNVVESTTVAADPCSAVASGSASSLVSYGKGALPVRNPDATGLIAPDSSAQVVVDEQECLSSSSGMTVKTWVGQPVFG